MIEQLPLTHVFTRKDARPIVEATVRGLVDSIREVGIINPIRVRPARRFVAGVEADAWEVTAGAHRVSAARRLGLETVPAFVVSDDDLHAELAMIDENLMRAELSAADRAAQTVRRKAIYEELHPDTRHGGDRASRQLGDLNDERFTAATAAATGKSERAVQRDAERGEKISEQALALVRGTKLDKGSTLDDLKKVDPEKQVAWVERRLAAPVAPKPPKVASDPLTDELASEKQVARLMDAWNAAGPDARQEFLLRIDVPVFDRSAA
jgi:ParB-like chromosome segregation protein Spo0J